MLSSSIMKAYSLLKGYKCIPIRAHTVVATQHMASGLWNTNCRTLENILSCRSMGNTMGMYTTIFANRHIISTQGVLMQHWDTAQLVQYIVNRFNLWSVHLSHSNLMNVLMNQVGSCVARSISVKVVTGCTVLFGSRIINCSQEETLLSRLEEDKSESDIFFFLTVIRVYFVVKLAPATKH